MSTRAVRLEGAVSRGRPVTIVVDGERVGAFEGETVATALLAAGRRATRITLRTGAPRGLFCGMGVCFDCVAVIDGSPHVRTCVTPVRDGMVVSTRLP